VGYYNAVYGPLTSVIILLLWIYVGANILIMGASLSSVLATRHRQVSSPDSVSDS
jgi:membrane protein